MHKAYCLPRYLFHGIMESMELVNTDLFSAHHNGLSSFCNSIYGIPWYHGRYGKVDTDLCSAPQSAQVLAISAKSIWFLMVLSWNLLKLGRGLLQTTSML
jgi:hypothetical protein